MIHAQLLLAGTLLGVATPPLAALDRDESGESPLIAEFWETYDYIVKGERPLRLNHSRERHTIAIHLPQFERAARERSIPLASLRALRGILCGSRRPRFLRIGPVSSELYRATLDCWIFDASASE